MDLRVIVASAALFFSPTAAVEKAENTTVNISKIYSLFEIPQPTSLPEETLYLFDLDDTLIDFPYMLGSKAWRRYIVQVTKEIDPNKNWHDRLTYLLTQKYPVQAVETQTSEFIKNLQDRGYLVCGLTARERDKWYDTPKTRVDLLTTNQLSSVNINFTTLENHFPDLANDSEYYQGTFFANYDLKGDYLKKLFQNLTTFPTKIIFIDDKDTQVSSVANALSDFGIEHECYHYLATEEKGKKFNPLIANIQLYHFLESNVLLTDTEALKKAQEDPSQDAEFYLRVALEKAKETTKEPFDSVMDITQSFHFYRYTFFNEYLASKLDSHYKSCSKT